MVDTGFDDFLDSDDDEFFREASNQFLDYDATPDFSKLSEKNYTSTQLNTCTTLTNKPSCANPTTETKCTTSNTTKIVAECEETSPNYEIPPELASDFKSDYFSDSDDVLINECKSIPVDFTGSDTPKPQSNVPVNVSTAHVKESGSSQKLNEIESSNQSKLLVDERKIALKSFEIEPKISTESNCDTDVHSPAISPNKSNLAEAQSSITHNSSNFNKRNSTPASSYINNRFTPGFTPKAKKRKLPGPAGLIEMFDDSGSKETEASSSSSQSMLCMDIGFENVVSSQFAPEHLSLLSWQKLQTAVSSCQNLHSTVKYYSIQRVLQESSKKKLPKHMVVPVLCVLLKKPSYKGPSSISVFMDDTGEINGKIDAEVIATYKDYLVGGTALILKNITFLCNVLILKVKSIVSIYHPDGTEKHTQSLESILQTPEPLKPMNCECLMQPHNSLKKDNYLHHNDKNYHKPSCISHSQNSSSDLNHNKTVPRISQDNTTPVRNKLGGANFDKSGLTRASNENRIVGKNTFNSNCRENPISDETVNHRKTMRSDAFLENLLDGDNCMDDFDELLGNLDEKSFMEEM